MLSRNASLPHSSDTFPPTFLWGTATAAHQVEGNNLHSDWWDFEKLPGRVKNGEHSGRACDHWNRLEEDVALMREMGVNSYRFTIEWAKIEPREGDYDEDAIEHYRYKIRLLEEAGIEPMITLHHFTSPRWFREKGAWEWEASAAKFAEYARFVAREITPGCRLWCTVNEPMVHLGGGYVAGVTPPETKDFGALKRPLLGLLRAHAAAYRALKEASPQNQVGMAHHYRIFAPKRRWNPIDRIVARSLDSAFNWTIPTALETGHVRMKLPLLLNIDETLDEVRGTQDYFGLNYYTRDFMTLGLRNGRIEPIPSARLGAPTNDLNWELYPQGFRRAIDAIAKRFPGRAIYVTENGIADRDDSRRPEFLRSHLRELGEAIRDGAPVHGYFHWSLMDNFEWIEGFDPRFGLIEIDYATMARKPRPSARVYAEIIRASRVESVRISVDS